MDPKQMTLFGKKNSEQEYMEIVNRYYDFSEAIKILDKIEWDFKDFNTQYLTHTFHSYPARFIPQIPLTFIKLFTKEKETVLDPFCGCGTTLVEAFLNNRNSIGNDFNPLAALISKVKTTLIEERDFRYFDKKLAVMKQYFSRDHRISELKQIVSNMPKRKISKIFNQVVISRLEIIHETLLEVKEEGYEDLFDFGRVALSSTIWSLVENEAGIEVEDLFLKKVKAMQRELKKMAKMIKDPPEVRVICGDARKLDLENNSIDLIVTSPPYVNALDYYRVHMYAFRIFRGHASFNDRNE